jgi:O-antigen/teichoic acid export membrane protein
VTGRADDIGQPRRITETVRRLLRWALRAGFSILDQGLVSVANFGLSVLLARLLLPADYGAFAIAFSAFLAAAGIHNALLVEPMTVLGPARYQNDLVVYMGRVFRLHILVTVPLALSGAVMSLFFFRSALGPALLVMSLCLPFLLLFWTTRRAHYLESHADLAATSSLLYCLILIALMLIARKSGHLTAGTSFVAMAVASVLAGMFSLVRLKVGLVLGGVTREAVTQLLREHWSFGKWILPSALLFPLMFQVQLFATGALMGLPAAGVLRALQNPIMPAIQIVSALGLLAITPLARSFGEGRTEETYRRGWNCTCAMILVASAYELVLLLTGSLWDTLLYKGRYAGWEGLMPILGLVPVATAATAGCSLILRAIQRPGLITVANLAGGIIGIGSIYPLIARWNLAGAAYGLLASQVAAAAATVALVKFSNKPAEAGAFPRARARRSGCGQPLEPDAE